jgi:hypothetical protein
MALQDLIPPPVTAAMLASDGLLPAEIAATLGLPLADVMRELGEAWAQPAHVARVEAALFDAAIGGETWREVADKAGGTLRLASDRRPDVQAAKAVLAARMPAMYGQDAAPPIRVVVDVRAALPEGYVRSALDEARWGALENVTPAKGGK